MLTQLVDSGTASTGASDVQETSFSLDAVARFVCNSIDEVQQAEREGGFQFDAVVIGSGMYGSFFAAKIFERAKREPGATRPRVLVLESGPFLVSEHYQNLTRMGDFFNLVNRPVVDDNQSFLTQIDRKSGPLQGMSPHHRCVGGKSLFWGGWGPRLMNDAAGDDLSRWPKDVRDFLLSPQGYELIERQIGTQDTADYVKGQLLSELRTKAGQIIADGTVATLTGVMDAPIAVQAQGPVSGLFSMDKYSSLPLLLDSIREDAEASGGSNANRFLFLVPRTEVLRLNTVEGRVHELVLLVRQPSRDPRNPGTRTRIVRLPLKGGAVILLAGNTINSTRLALNSFPRPATVGPELIGRNLMVHVRGNYAWRVRKDALSLPLLEDLSTAALHLAGRVGPSPPVNRPGRYHFQFYALGSTGTNYDEFLYRLIPNTEDLDDAARAVRSTDMRDWIVVGIRTCGETFGDLQADSSLRESSTISVNPFGGAGDDVHIGQGGEQIRVPKVFVSLVQRDVDARIRAAQTDAAFAFVAALIGEVPALAHSTTDDRLQFIGGGEDGMGTTYHECGTMWMGEEQATSVTDVYGHFHHVTNAYCIDQALFPTCGSANPVPTGLALASRIASHVVGRFRSEPLLPVEPGFVSLFDGTLDNWDKFGSGRIEVLPGLQIIECGTSGTDSVLGFVRTRQQFEDFRLRLDWKAFDIRANSGVFLRMPEVDNGDFDGTYAGSIEIQIDETGKNVSPGNPPSYGSGLHKTGAVYGIVPASRWAAKAVSSHGTGGFWNAFDITLQGDRVTVVVNGETVVDQARLPPHLLGGGSIGLQCHTEVVQFRNLRISSL